MIIKFDPIFKTKMWGGQKMRARFNYALPSEKTGECWGIAAHTNGDVTIKDGLYQGETLSSLWQNQRHLFGNHRADEFPILVKFIDAADDLSVQVHPDDAMAKTLGSYGKTECWYIVEAEADATLIIGHHAKSLAELKQHIENDTIESIVQKVPVSAKDYFFIDAGTLHGIGKGTLLLEVQQSSDITYRFYDYNRLEEGKRRPLHIEEALSVVNVPDAQVKQTHDERYFGFDIVSPTGEKMSAHTYGDFLIVIEGDGFIDKKAIQAGDFLFVSSESSYRLHGAMQLARVTLR